jgi:hypothetical protein
MLALALPASPGGRAEAAPVSVGLEVLEAEKFASLRDAGSGCWRTPPP